MINVYSSDKNNVVTKITLLDCQKIAENLTYFPKELPKIFIKKKKKKIADN